jgi:hypothetical protein
VRRAAVIFVGALCVVLTGCNSSRSSGPHASNANIHGSVQESGGPGPGKIGISADVTVAGAAGTYHSKSNPDGTYNVAVVAGSYTVSAKFGDAMCNTVKIDVQVSMVATADVDCSVK